MHSHVVNRGNPKPSNLDDFDLGCPFIYPRIPQKAAATVPQVCELLTINGYWRVIDTSITHLSHPIAAGNGL